MIIIIIINGRQGTINWKRREGNQNHEKKKKKSKHFKRHQSLQKPLGQLANASLSHPKKFRDKTPPTARTLTF